MDLLLLEIKNVFLPEAILLFFILINIVFSLFLSKKIYKFAGRIALLAILLPMISMLFWISAPGSGYNIFSGEFIQTNFTFVVKILIMTGTIFTILLSQDFIKELKHYVFDFYTLLLISTFGSICLVSSNDFIPLFISIETITISNCMLISFQNKTDAKKNALKYLINSSVCTGFLLFGISYLYGVSGNFNFSLLNAYYYSQDSSILFSMAVIFILLGLMFSATCMPFQRWLPDINTQLNHSIAAYISVVPQIAILGILARIIANIFCEVPFLQFIITIIALCTIAYGFLAAIKQSNIKKFLSCSNIAHCGFMLLAISVFSSYGAAAFIYYAITYLFMNFGVWAAAITFVKYTGSDEIKDYSGLFYIRPYYTISFVICLISLAGLPPLSGFLSKLYLFTAIMRSDASGLPILAMSAIMTILGLFVYLNLIQIMFDKCKNPIKFITIQLNTKFVMYFCTLITILTFFFANKIIWLSMFASLGI